MYKATINKQELTFNDWYDMKNAFEDNFLTYQIPTMLNGQKIATKESVKSKSGVDDYGHNISFTLNGVLTNGHRFALSAVYEYRKIV